MENDTRLKGDIAKKIIKLILKIAYQILVIICVILIIIILLQKITNSNKTILGYRIFRVITGSMEPEYDVGEVVICKEIDPEEIKVGDDIVYFGTYGEYNGKIIMHEVTQIDRDENNNLNFHAKGLHMASVEDPQVKASQIFGVVIFKSEILTVLYKWVSNTYSAFIIITILAINIFISFKASGKEKVQQLNEANEVNEGFDDNDEKQQIEDVETKEENYEDEVDEKEKVDEPESRDE